MASINHAVRAVAAALLLTAGAGAQQSGGLSIRGTVINARTGEPVARALVHLYHHAPPPDESQGELTIRRPLSALTLSTLADSLGVFQFTGLPAGSCSLTAQKPGFEEDSKNESAGPDREIQLTASIGNVAIRLSPLGVITGTVTDEEGRPVYAVQVVALTVKAEDGLRRSAVARTVFSDDRGAYRIWNLEPAKYYVKAEARGGGTALYVGERGPRAADTAFAPVYHGGGSSLDSAAPMTIEPGSQARADLKVHLQQAYRISGSLQNFVPHRVAKFELLSGDEEASANRVSLNGDTGRFAVEEVVRGVYTLRVTQGQTRVDIPITVDGADVSGVAAPLAPGVDINVTSQLMGEATETVDGIPGERGHCNVTLNGTGRSVDERSYEDASLIPGVLPGRYRVTINCYGAYVQFASMGDQDLLANPLVTVQPGVTPPPIQITAKRGGGTVSGCITAANRKPGGEAVLLVPQFAGTTGPVLSQTGEPFRQEQSADAPSFTFVDLAPGAYLAYAFASADGVEYRNSEFLRSLTGGVAVRVTDGGETEIEIKEVKR